MVGAGADAVDYKLISICHKGDIVVSAFASVRCLSKRHRFLYLEKDATIEQKAVKEVNAGIYCINWKTISPAFANLKNNNAQGEYYLTDIVKWAVEKNLNVQSFILKNNEEIFGINSKVQLSEATKITNQLMLLLTEENTIIKNHDKKF